MPTLSLKRITSLVLVVLVPILLGAYWFGRSGWGLEGVGGLIYFGLYYTYLFLHWPMFWAALLAAITLVIAISATVRAIRRT